MQSPLAGLCEVLVEVKRRAQVYAPSNEAQTRTALINPILEALGWNLSDPHEVELEKHYNSAQKSDFIDYILNGNSRIIVEAKKMGAALDNGFDQIFLYAQRARIKNVFLTNGIEWRHYINQNSENNYIAGHINFLPGHDPINLIEIADEDLPIKAGAYLIANLDAALFIKPVKADETVEDELRSRIDELEKMIVEVEGTVSCISEGRVSPTVVRVGQEPWLVLGDGRWDPKGRRPKRLRLPDNSEVAVGGWSKVLTEICTYCLTKKPELLDPLPILDKAGRNTKLVDTISSTGNCTQVTINDKVYFVNVLYSASASVANAVYMLEKLGEGNVAKAAVLLAE
ncbi:MAG: type I restriction enzyme HsdR N-terminal domain-containing protein [Desulfuromonadaceae bacterium]|nr:type I restriction enzyme HsdR N-terminal domain-containing protein [Desulfuromonadaceae bacterium]